MNCPACKAEMVEEDFGGVKVDVCKKGCKSMWFDYAELETLDENHEGFGNALKEELNSPRVKDDNRGSLNCPKCNRPMKAHLYQRAKTVTVDECYSCGGFFLDAGELKVIRDNFLDEQQRKEFRDAILGQHPVFDEIALASKWETERAKAVEKVSKTLTTNVMQKILYGKG